MNARHKKTRDIVCGFIFPSPAMKQTPRESREKESGKTARKMRLAAAGRKTQD